MREIERELTSMSYKMLLWYSVQAPLTTYHYWRVETELAPATPDTH